MRLTCDNCSALYTIEDGLVGTRDFRVSCKSCGKPIFVKSARQVTLAATHRVNLPGGALPRPSVLAAFAARTQVGGHAHASAAAVRTETETWFVSIDGRQRGPLGVTEMAAMFEAGTLDWDTEIWREGLKGWRPARRDPLLVTSVAGARGAVNDTTRLDAARSFLAPEDTVVEPAFGHAAGRKRSARASRKERADETEKQQLEPRAQSAKAEIPDLRPSARPQAWHSPENTAFREALGLPTDSSQQASDGAHPEPAGPAPEAKAAAASSAAPDLGPTLADAFASATRLLDAQRADRRGPRQSGLFELLPADLQERLTAFYERNINSHYLVAASSFAAGVLVTALVLGRPVGSDAPAVAQAAPVAAAAAAIELPQIEIDRALAEPSAGTSASSAMPVATVQANPPSSVADPQPVMRELPTVEDLRREVRKVALDVRRCMGGSNTGVDVDIYLTGFTGGVREVHVRTSTIPPGRAACIIQAVHRMQVAPFSRNELKLMHKFSW